MDHEFDSLARRFARLDDEIKSVKSSVEGKYALLLDEPNDVRLLDVMEQNLHKSRDFLLNKLNASLNRLLNANRKLRNLAAKTPVKYFASTHKFDHHTVTRLLVNKLNETNNYLKFKYKHLHDEVWTCDCASDCAQYTPPTRHYHCPSNVKRTNEHVKMTKLYLSQHLLFTLIEYKSKRLMFKIENLKQRKDLYVNRIALKYDQSYQIMSYDCYIVMLVHNDVHSQLNLLYFDKTTNELMVLKDKFLNYRVSLHSMNRHELVCLVNSSRLKTTGRYLTLDMSDLEQTGSFGQNTNDRAPFFLGDGSLIGLSLNRIYIYYYDIIKQEHKIKILNRLSGCVEAMLDLGHNGRATTKHSLIKLDSSSRLLIKYVNSDLVHYHDSNGKFLFTVPLNKLKSFDFISDTVLCLNQTNSSLSFI